MPCNHIMLDLETLSTRKDAAIIQLAARAFDPVTGELGAEFNAFIRNPSGHIDVQIVAWWMQQAPAAAIGAEVASVEAFYEAAALNAFAEWLQNDTARGCELEALWSHGATFDIVLLENAFARNGLGKPWSYRVERDTRTLYALAPGGMPAVTTDPQRKHDARYDCDVQIQQVVGALKALRNMTDAAIVYDRYEHPGLPAGMYVRGADDGPNPPLGAQGVPGGTGLYTSLAEQRAAHDADGKSFNPEPCARVTPSAVSECEIGECDACQVARGEDPFNYDGIPIAARPSPAVPTALPCDLPPVWSNAESYTEALANPDCAPPSSDDWADSDYSPDAP